MAQDLVDAVVALLVNTPSVATAFGDTWNQAAGTGVAKIFADVADQVAVPYAVLTEVGETYQYMTAVVGGAVPFVATGQLKVDVWAPDRFRTRQLGFAIAAALNDAPLAWPLEAEMEFRLVQSVFVPAPGQSAPGHPIVFHRVLIFEYAFSGAL